MARDYDRRNNRSKQKTNGLKQLVWVVVAFVSGYFTAAVFDLNSLNRWLNSNVIANSNTGSNTSNKLVAKQEAPKPKFEFYTLLAKDPNKVASLPKPAVVAEQRPLTPTPIVAQAPVTQAPVAVAPQPALTTQARQQAKAPVVAAATPATPVKPIAQVDLRQAKETFLIQIASFRNRQDAEKLKASLILKGFDVNVAMATQNQANWYRVIVGPFASRNDAMKTQNILARNERIQGMIRKVG